jgi:hypothetical protein
MENRSLGALRRLWILYARRRRRRGRCVDGAHGRAPMRTGGEERAGSREGATLEVVPVRVPASSKSFSRGLRLSIRPVSVRRGLIRSDPVPCNAKL